MNSELERTQTRRLLEDENRNSEIGKLKLTNSKVDFTSYNNHLFKNKISYSVVNTWWFSEGVGMYGRWQS